MPDTSERIAELRRELESNPLSRQFYQLGELLRRDGRAAEAVTVLRGGLGHHPRYVAAWVSLGRACLDRTEPKGAADALHEALELDAQNPVAWRLLGEARLGSGDRFGALDAMEHALQLAPGDEVLRAAVDALASETWPPGAVPGPGAGAPDATRREEAAVREPFAAGPAEASQPIATLPAAPQPDTPVAAAAPAVRAAPAAAIARELDDPFSVTGTGLSVEAFADVFAAPAESASFADEPFGRSSAPVARPVFLEDFAPFEPPSPATPAAAPVAAAAAAELEIALPEEAEQPQVFVPESAEVEAQLVATTEAASVEPAVAAMIAEPPPEIVEEPPEQTFAASEAEEPEEISFEAVPAAVLVEPPAERVPETRAAPAGAPPTLTMARLHLQQQDFPAAIGILERIVAREPDNQEARDLLDLVHDMMAPLPGELPLASVRERKIAALQGWLASLTLGQERMSL